MGSVCISFDGWIALYNSAGVAQDAIYWPSAQTNITSSEEYAGNPQTPSAAPYQGLLPSAKEIFQTTPSVIAWTGKQPNAGKVFMRTTDGAASWTEGTLQ